MTNIEGCRRHAVQENDVSRRWAKLSAHIEAAVAQYNDEMEAEREREAQAAGLTACHCCGGPSKNERVYLCSRCASGCSSTSCECAPEPAALGDEPQWGPI